MGIVRDCHVLRLCRHHLPWSTTHYRRKATSHAESISYPYTLPPYAPPPSLAAQSSNPRKPPHRRGLPHHEMMRRFSAEPGCESLRQVKASEAPAAFASKMLSSQSQIRKSGASRIVSALVSFAR